MKRQFLMLVFLVVFLLSFKSISAQNLNVFGVKGGVNFVDIRDKLSDNSVTHVRKSGFYLGAFIELRRSVNFSIQPELSYSANKNKIDENVELLHIPILFKYKLGDYFELYGGPESQFLLSVKGVDINKNRSYKKYILAACAGFGFSITNDLIIDARYNLAISNFIDSGFHQNEKLNFIQVGIAYKFDE